MGGRQKGGRPGVGGDYPSPGSEMSNGFHLSKGEAERSLSIHGLFDFMIEVNLRGPRKWTSTAVVGTWKRVFGILLSRSLVASCISPGRVLG